MQSLINKAFETLVSGDLIVLPTETVYGLAADASNKNAVKKIFELKNRPSFNPLISHYADLEEIKNDVEVNERARKIFEAFSPGPITLVLKKTLSSRICDLATAGLKTAAVRIPDHPVTLEILKKFAGPVAAPSANPSTKLSPTKKLHVEKCFPEIDLLIIDGGDCKTGLESTILDLSTQKAIILRFGTITSQEIENVLQEKIYLKDESGVIKAPGSLLKHYAPTTKLRINFDPLIDTALVNEALLSFGDIDLSGFKVIMNLSPGADLAEAAKNLFSYFHELDQMGFDSIAVVKIPNEGIGIAINEKLNKACN